MLSFKTGLSIGAEAIVVGELSSYFHERYSIAIAISQTGLAAGIMTIPLLTQLLIDTYGWRGSMLLLGGINLHLVVSGALLTPVIPNLKDIKSIKERQSEHVMNKTMHQMQVNIANEHKSSIVTSLIYYLDLPLFQNAAFISMFVYSLGNSYCLTGWLIYLVPFAVDVGLPSYKAVSLSSYGGFGNLLGNILYPLLTKRFSSNQIILFFSVISFLAILVYPPFSVFDSYIGLVFASIIFGCARGVATLCMYQITKEGVEGDRATNAVTWLCVSHSIGAILSGFLSGLYGGHVVPKVI